MSKWIEVKPLNEIEMEDMIRFDYDEKSFVVYRTNKNMVYATDGFCTHQRIDLSEGLLVGNIVECPKHNGRFDITNGEAKRKPACVPLKTYQTKIESGMVYVDIC